MRAMVLLCQGLGLAFASGPVAAQSATSAAILKAGTYVVDPSRTRISFALVRLGFAYYSGTFANASGTLRLDPTNPSLTTLEVTMPIGSLSTGDAAIDSDLRGPAWFDAGRYPSATFVSTSIVATGADSAEITGTLTLHGVTQTEILDARYVSAGVNPTTGVYEVAVEADSTIRRSDFGLTAFRPIIGDDVRLGISGVFVARR